MHLRETITEIHKAGKNSCDDSKLYMRATAIKYLKSEYPQILLDRKLKEIAIKTFMRGVIGVEDRNVLSVKGLLELRS
jgi:hypothetical protein